MAEWLELAQSLGISEDMAEHMWRTDEFVIASGRVVLLAPMGAAAETPRHDAEDRTR